MDDFISYFFPDSLNFSEKIKVESELRCLCYRKTTRIGKALVPRVKINFQLRFLQLFDSRYEINFHGECYFSEKLSKDFYMQDFFQFYFKRHRISIFRGRGRSAQYFPVPVQF